MVDIKTDEVLIKLVEKMYNELVSGEVPELKLSSRTKDNIVFDQSVNVWKYGGSYVSRSAKTTDGAQFMAKALYTIEFIMDMIKSLLFSLLSHLKHRFDLLFPEFSGETWVLKLRRYKKYSPWRIETTFK